MSPAVQNLAGFRRTRRAGAFITPPAGTSPVAPSVLMTFGTARVIARCVLFLHGTYRDNCFIRDNDFPGCSDRAGLAMGRARR